MFNHGDQEFQIQEGDRIAQLILEQIADKPVIEVRELTQTQRENKGFGSTGSQQINIISGRKGNNKYFNNTRNQKEGSDGKDERGGKVDAYRKSPPLLPDPHNRGDIPKCHAPTPPNDPKSTSPLPPEPLSPRTLSAIANRIAPLPSVAAVLDSEESPSALENKAWNSSSESCLAPSSSLSHVQLLKSRNSDGGLGYDDETEEEMDSNSRSNLLDCTWGMMGMEEEFLCPSLTEGIGETIRPPHPAQNDPSLKGAEARMDRLDRIPWENCCKGTQ